MGRSQPAPSSFCFASWHVKRLNKTQDSQPLRLHNPAPHILFPFCTSTVGNSNCSLYCPALKGRACFLSQGQSLLNVLPPFEMNPPTLPLSPTVSFSSPPPSRPRLLFLIKPHPGCREGRGKDSEDFRAPGSGAYSRMFFCEVPTSL